MTSTSYERVRLRAVVLSSRRRLFSTRTTLATRTFFLASDDESGATVGRSLGYNK